MATTSTTTTMKTEETEDNVLKFQIDGLGLSAKGRDVILIICCCATIAFMVEKCFQLSICVCRRLNTNPCPTQYHVRGASTSR